MELGQCSLQCFQLTARKNKSASSTKSALLVHIKYLYNSKLVWDFLQSHLKLSECSQACQTTTQQKTMKLSTNMLRDNTNVHLFYLNWHAASHLNCYEFLQQMTTQNFKQ
jgi:hypothetical protein